MVITGCILEKEREKDRQTHRHTNRGKDIEIDKEDLVRVYMQLSSGENNNSLPTVFPILALVPFDEYVVFLI